MTDNELNALVAKKVMGREVYQGEFPYENPALVIPGSWGFVEGYGSQPEVENCPDYCNDIAAAWQVLETFKARGIGWRIQLDIGGESWTVYNHDDGILLAGWNSGNSAFLAGWDAADGYDYIAETADTASRAICLAALKAVR